MTSFKLILNVLCVGIIFQTIPDKHSIQYYCTKRPIFELAKLGVKVFLEEKSGLFHKSNSKNKNSKIFNNVQ